MSLGKVSRGDANFATKSLAPLAPPISHRRIQSKFSPRQGCRPLRQYIKDKARFFRHNLFSPPSTQTIDLFHFHKPFQTTTNLTKQINNNHKHQNAYSKHLLWKERRGLRLVCTQQNMIALSSSLKLTSSLAQLKPSALAVKSQLCTAHVPKPKRRTKSRDLAAHAVRLPLFL